MAPALALYAAAGWVRDDEFLVYNLAPWAAELDQRPGGGDAAHAPYRSRWNTLSRRSP
jgi:hypothetical protein